MAYYSQPHSGKGARLKRAFRGISSWSNYFQLHGNWCQDPKGFLGRSRPLLGLGRKWWQSRRARPLTFTKTESACSNPNISLSPYLSCFLFAIPLALVIFEKGLASLDSSLQNPTSQSILWYPGAPFFSCCHRGAFILLDPPSSGFSCHPLYFQNFLLLCSPPPKSLNTWPKGSCPFQITIYFLLLLEFAQGRKGKAKEQRHGRCETYVVVSSSGAPCAHMTLPSWFPRYFSVASPPTSSCTGSLFPLYTLPLTAWFFLFETPKNHTDINPQQRPLLELLKVLSRPNASTNTFPQGLSHCNFPVLAWRGCLISFLQLRLQNRDDRF